MPVYLVAQWRDILQVWPLVLAATVGVIVGTTVGRNVLGRLPRRTFRRAIAVLLTLLSLYMTIAGGK